MTDIKILLLCNNCCQVVGIKSNHLAENKVGRRYCYGCGWNNEDWMHVDDESVVKELVDKVNKAFKDNDVEVSYE